LIINDRHPHLRLMGHAQFGTDVDDHVPLLNSHVGLAHLADGEAPPAPAPAPTATPATGSKPE
jgi:hypothetical protein